MNTPWGLRGALSSHPFSFDPPALHPGRAMIDIPERKDKERKRTGDIWG